MVSGIEREGAQVCAGAKEPKERKKEECRENSPCAPEGREDPKKKRTIPAKTGKPTQMGQN